MLSGLLAGENGVNIVEVGIAGVDIIDPTRKKRANFFVIILARDLHSFFAKTFQVSFIFSLSMTLMSFIARGNQNCCKSLFKEHFWSHFIKKIHWGSTRKGFPTSDLLNFIPKIVACQKHCISICSGLGVSLTLQMQNRVIVKVLVKYL